MVGKLLGGEPLLLLSILMRSPLIFHLVLASSYIMIEVIISMGSCFIFL